MKKKGLLISTIVMVVVLVASLTTATYAWFSANAEVKVENLNVTTQATKGLEIAVKTTAGDGITDAGEGVGYVTDFVQYDTENEKFILGTDGWSSRVDFSSLTSTSTENAGTIGIWDSAVGYVTKNSDKYYVGGTSGTLSQEVTDMVFDLVTGIVVDETSVNGYYKPVVADNATVLTLINDEAAKAESGVTYYQKVAAGDSTWKEGSYLIPIGYNTLGDNTLKPYGYYVAKQNKDYMVLPIVVRPTTEVNTVYCEIDITKQTNGMAQASRIIIKNGAGTETVVLEPTFADEANTWSYKFAIATSEVGKAILKNQVLETTFTIWIEGSDEDCVNDATGTGFEINIDYSFDDYDGQGTTLQTGFTTNNITRDDLDVVKA